VTLDLIRCFTVQAFESIDLLVIPINDLLKMKLEFPKYFNELFKNSKEKLRRDLIYKIEIIKNHELKEVVKDGDKNLKSRFAYAFLGNLLQKLKKKSDRGVSSVDVNPLIPLSPINDDASSNAQTPMGI
jgi:hypothetical protein